MSDPVTYVIIGLEAKDWLEELYSYRPEKRYNEKTGEPYEIKVKDVEYRVGGKLIEFPEDWVSGYDEDSPAYYRVAEFLELMDYPRDPLEFAHQMAGIIGVRLSRVDAYGSLSVVGKDEFHEALTIAREGLRELGIEKEPNTITIMH